MKRKPTFFPIPGIKTEGNFMVGMEWPIIGSTGRIYTIGFNDKGLDCSCPGFGWHGKCKHVKSLAEKLAST